METRGQRRARQRLTAGTAPTADSLSALPEALHLVIISCLPQSDWWAVGATCRGLLRPYWARFPRLTLRLPSNEDAAARPQWDGTGMRPSHLVVSLLQRQEVMTELRVNGLALEYLALGGLGGGRRVTRLGAGRQAFVRDREGAGAPSTATSTRPAWARLTKSPTCRSCISFGSGVS